LHFVSNLHTKSSNPVITLPQSICYDTVNISLYHIYSDIFTVYMIYHCIVVH